MNLDAIAYAVNVENQGSNLVDAHALGVSELTVGSVFNFPATGSLDIGGDVYEYTAIDDEANTVTLSGVTTAAYDDDARVELSPAAPVWFATVVVGSDQPGFNAMVPIHLVPMLADDEGGSVFPDGIPVRLESISAGEFEWQVVDAPGRQPSINATTTPIIVTTDAGESVRIDGDGLTGYTDDVVGTWSVLGNFGDMAADGGYLYARVQATSDIHKFDGTTGVEVTTGGFPIVTTANWIAADAGFIYAVDGGGDIHKFNATTGVEITAGFPILGSFNELDAYNGFIYGRQFGGDLEKYNATTGVQDTSGDFPITGNIVRSVTVADGFIYGFGDADFIVRKFDAITGAQVDYDIGIKASTFAAGNGFLYVEDGGVIRKFDGTTGVEVPVTPDPVVLLADLVVDGAIIYGQTSTGDLYAWSDAGKTVAIYSGTGNSEIGDLIVRRDARVAGSLTVGAATLGPSNQKTLATGVTPTSTTNIDMPDLALTFNVTGPSDVVWVALNASITITTAGTVNIVEMLLDAVADPAQLITRAPAGPQILAGRQDWRLTGLSAGPHTVTFRTRNTAAATSASVNGTHTRSSYWTST